MIQRQVDICSFLETVARVAKIYQYSPCQLVDDIYYTEYYDKIN
jgi:hypothetical protein